MAFDGRSDFLTCAGTAAALAFIHKTGVFDMALTFRRTGGVNNGEHRVFGSEPTGLALLMTPYSFVGSSIVSLDGGFKFLLNDGVAQISAFTTVQYRAPLGEVSSLFIRGDGASLRLTQDWWNWDTQAFLAAPTGVGNASHDYAVGASNGAASSDFWMGLDLLSFLVWNRNLNITEQLVVKANFAEQAAFQ